MRHRLGCSLASLVVGCVGDSPLFIVATEYLARPTMSERVTESFSSRGNRSLVWTVLKQSRVRHGHLFRNHHTEIVLQFSLYKYKN